MKVLYVASDQDLSTYHGGTVHLLAVAGELTKHKHEVHVVVQESQSDHIDLPEYVRGYRLPRRHRFLLWRSGSQIQKLLERIEPDLVIERYYNFAGEAVLRASKSHIPSILEVNSPMIDYPDSWRQRADRFLLGSLKRRRNKIADSASLIITPIKEIIPAAFHSKVQELEWGADTELFEPAYLPDRDLLRIEKGFSPDETLIIHFGSLRKWHGLEKLLEAFDLARRRINRPIQLIVIGPALRISQENVHFTGTIPHQEMPAWLKMSNMAVLPFSPEHHRYLQLGFYWSPLKIFEAMAMELPIITLRHPRIASILGTDDSMFYYDGSVQDLSEKIVSMHENLLACSAVAKQFRQRLLRYYSWKIHGNRLHQCITELTSGE